MHSIIISINKIGDSSMLMRILVPILLVLAITGCASMEMPTAERFIPPLSGASPLHLGATKDYVRDQWGDPEEINSLGYDEVGLEKEEWIYTGRKLPVIEIEPKLLVKGENLIFTGHALTGYRKKEK
jgi:hypothetical protein